MLNLLVSPIFLRTIGLLGSLAILLAVLLPGLIYTGKQGERYSILNHFISELGEQGVSRLAVVFNAGLICAGLVFLVFVIGVGLLIPGIFAKLGLVVGCVAAISLSLVGVFPMNNLKRHGQAALMYFRSMLVMELCFGLAIILQPAGQEALPRALALVCLAAVATYGAFLILLGKPAKEEGEEAEVAGLDPTNKPVRPKFWLLPSLEWLVFAASILWFFTTALVLG